MFGEPWIVATIIGLCDFQAVYALVMGRRVFEGKERNPKIGLLVCAFGLMLVPLAYLLD